MSLTRRAVLPVLFVGVGFVVGACEDGQLPTTSPTPPPAPPPTPPPEPEPEPPPVPTGLRVAATGDNFIEWTWNPVVGADGYEVQFSLDEVFTDGDEVVVRTAAETSYRRLSLPPGTSGFLRVRSLTGAGATQLQSEWSAPVAGMTAAPQAPAVPMGLYMSGRSQSYIEWRWNPVVGADGYEVQFSLGEVFTDGDEVVVRTAAETSYRRLSLPPGTSGFLRVRSLTGAGATQLRSEWSAPVAGMTAAPQAPAVPMGLYMSGRSQSYIEWRWNPVAGADGYEVQFSLDEVFTDGDEVVVRTAAETSYRRPSLPPGTSGFLRVRSLTGAGEARLWSRWSASVAGKTLGQLLPDSVPTDLRVSASGYDFIEWSWNAVSAVEGYEVQFRENAQFTYDDPTYDIGTELTYRRTGLGYDTRGYLRVRAYIGTGERHLSSLWSEAATGRTSQPPPPVTVSFVEESMRATEGETVEILVALSGGDPTGPLRIQVGAEPETAAENDYVLVTAVIEIPQSGPSEKTTTISFEALEDELFAEGDERLWLRLQAPDESDVGFGPRLGVTIHDAGVSPCEGIRVRAEPPTEDPGGAVQTRLTLLSDIRGGAVAADWIGPYQDYQGRALGRTIQNQFNLQVQDWSFRMEGATSHQEITIWWNPEEEFGLRFRSSDGACAGEPVLACTGANCEMRQ